MRLIKRVQHTFLILCLLLSFTKLFADTRKPSLIYIFVSDPTLDGYGDIVINIKAYDFIKEHNPDARIEYLCSVKTCVQLKKFLGSDATNTAIHEVTPYKSNLPKADVMIGFFTYDKKDLQNKFPFANHYDIHDEFPSDSRLIHRSLEEARAKLPRLEESIPEGAELGLTYTYSPNYSEMYLEVMFTHAIKYPDKKYIFYAKEIPIARVGWDIKKIPPNVELRLLHNLPTRQFEALVNRCTLPVFVTGTNSLNFAIDYGKPFFYEYRAYNPVRLEGDKLKSLLLKDGLPLDLADAMFLKTDRDTREDVLRKLRTLLNHSQRDAIFRHYEYIRKSLSYCGKAKKFRNKRGSIINYGIGLCIRLFRSIYTD